MLYPCNCLNYKIRFYAQFDCAEMRILKTGKKFTSLQSNEILYYTACKNKIVNRICKKSKK